MIEELYNKIDKFCNETDWSKYLTYEHALEEFIKEIVEEETKELEKENAELKADNDARKFAMAMSEKVEKQLREENAELKRDKEDLIFIRNQNAKCMCEDKEHLTKAKDLFLRFIELKNKPCASGHSINMLLYENICAEAEQFLNSEVEK